MEPLGSTPLHARTMGALGLGWAVVTVAAIALWQKAPAFVDASYGTAHQPFELLGMFLSLMALGFAVVWMWARTDRDATTVGILVLWLLPVFGAIHQISEYAKPSWDWKCYVGGAEAVMAGVSPYKDCYLYPPFVAEFMAGAYPAFAALGEFLSLNSPKHWMLVFFVWHSFQVLMVALSVYLLFRLLRRQGCEPLVAAAVVAALLIVCTPLERTIRHNQVNLVVLNLVLLGIDRARERPLAAGALVGLAAHIKLLPLVVLVPMAILRRHRLVLAGAGVTAAIAAYQIAFSSPPTLWQEFFMHGPQFVSGEYFRDNSFTGFIFNTVRVPIDTMGGTIVGLEGPLRLIGTAVSLAIGGAVLVAMRDCRDVDEAGALGLATMLLVSPVAWEHHYVWALPIVAILVGRHWRERPVAVGVVAMLICGLPTFDVYPLSYHRLAGLLLALRIVIVQGRQR